MVKRAWNLVSVKHGFHFSPLTQSCVIQGSSLHPWTSWISVKWRESDFPAESLCHVAKSLGTPCPRNSTPVTSSSLSVAAQGSAQPWSRPLGTLHGRASNVGRGQWECFCSRWEFGLITLKSLPHFKVAWFCTSIKFMKKRALDSAFTKPVVTRRRPGVVTRRRPGVVSGWPAAILLRVQSVACESHASQES